jgi:hypothetical protein
MSPFPTLPVDSVSNCSSQAPKSAIPGVVIMVTLSRPNFVAATPQTLRPRGVGGTLLQVIPHHNHFDAPLLDIPVFQGRGEV